MPIDTSVIASDVAQADGSRRVHETHTDHLGKTYDVVYYAPAGEDANALLAQRASGIETALAATERQEILLGNDPLRTADYITADALLTFARQFYKDATGEQAALAAKSILEWIRTGRYTDDAVRTEFRVTPVAWTAIKLQMQEQADAYDTVQNAVGA